MFEYVSQNTPKLQDCSPRTWTTIPQSFKLQKSTLKLRSPFFLNLQSLDPAPYFFSITQNTRKTALHYFRRKKSSSVGFVVCHIPGLSGFGTTGSFDCCPCGLLNAFSTGSLFSREMFVPDDFFMNNPSIATFDSSALVVFFMLCFGVPTGDENWTESC